ncbi:MAG: acetylxylan esterase [Verrucomicrobia bacterium]|nr:acetylxylan esterase [Verrucomicrobiota bacterium]
MARIQHPFPFDPAYGMSREDLLRITAPEPPADEATFWAGRYAAAVAWQPAIEIQEEAPVGDRRRFRVGFTSVGGVRIRGWLLVPRLGMPERGLVIAHGYGGRTGPDTHLPFADSALFFPCLRGLSLSRMPGVPAEPCGHVLHGIERRETYIHGGCVEDLWCAVTVLLELHPGLAGRIGFMGISFGGGIGAMALAWEKRVARAHLNVPSFGNHPVRLRCPTVGSGEAVRAYAARVGDPLPVLAYHDAATAARRIRIPVHCALAAFDPAVAPPGQFSIFNALPGPRELFLLQAGHFPYAAAEEEERRLLEELETFFSGL